MFYTVTTTADLEAGAAPYSNTCKYYVYLSCQSKNSQVLITNSNYQLQAFRLIGLTAQ